MGELQILKQGTNREQFFGHVFWTRDIRYLTRMGRVSVYMFDMNMDIYIYNLYIYIPYSGKNELQILKQGTNLLSVRPLHGFFLC